MEAETVAELERYLGQLETALNSGELDKASEYIKNMKELAEKLQNKGPAIVVDPDLPLENQAKGILRDTLAWLPKTVEDGYKVAYPSPVGVTTLNSLDLPVTLLTTLAGYSTYKLLVLAHSNWTVETVLPHIIMVTDVVAFFQGNPNRELVEGVYDRLLARALADAPNHYYYNRYRPQNLHTYIGLAPAVSEEFLHHMVESGTYGVLADPRADKELVAKAYAHLTYGRGGRLWLEYREAEGFITNPYTTDAMLRKLFPAIVGHRGMKLLVAKHPNTPEDKLSLLDGSNVPGVREALAVHPNASNELLKKLARSTVASISKPAKDRLADKTETAKQGTRKSMF